jgi:hypothetical protein
MRATDLIAYDVDGERHCLPCCRRLGIDTDQTATPGGYGGPVFASDEDGGTCSACLTPISEAGR